MLTNSTSRHSLPVLRALASSSQIELVGVVLHDSVAAGRRHLLATLGRHGPVRVAQKVHDLAVRWLAPWRHGAPTASETAQDFVRTENLEFHCTTCLSDPRSQTWMRDRRPDLLLSCSFSQILLPPTIELAPRGAINIHPSLLPRYRGPEPAFWMRYHGETLGGVTFHQVDARIDHGPVIAQYPLSIAPEWTPEKLAAESFALAAQHASGVLCEWAEGHCRAVPQDDAAASYFGYPTWKQRLELLRRSHRQ